MINFIHWLLLHKSVNGMIYIPSEILIRFVDQILGTTTSYISVKYIKEIKYNYKNVVYIIKAIDEHKDRHIQNLIEYIEQIKDV